MTDYILYREIPISKDDSEHPENWVFESDNEVLKFFIKKQTLEELVELVVQENKGRISKPGLSTISQAIDLNETYRKIPASQEELSEFYRLYEEIINSNNYDKK